MILTCWKVWLLMVIWEVAVADKNDEAHARAFIEEYMKKLEAEMVTSMEADWEYASNITPENLEKSNKLHSATAEYQKKMFKRFVQFDYKSFKDEDLKRTFKLFDNLQYNILPEDDYTEVMRVANVMTENFSNAKVCDYKNKTKCDLALEPEITEIFDESEDPEELTYYWKAFHDVASKPSRKVFGKYVELVNKAAKMNHFKSNAEMWLWEYEDETFEKQVTSVLERIKPFYEQMHAYVRFELRKKYGDIVPEKGPIPMHLTKNMWAQNWAGIAKFTQPFPKKLLVDVTDEMIKQNFTVEKIFEMGNDFFQSMGLMELPETFWKKSILEKPDDGRDLICHASAWYFQVPFDVRIKQCTRVNQEDFLVAHHELGHIQYYLQYQNLSMIYTDGANPGFHEAVGDVISLSVSTPKHLKAVGLIEDYVDDYESKINHLYSIALHKLVFIPFSYTIDAYRYKIFRGEIKPDQYNCKYWEMRAHYSGIEPPVKRSEKDFDPAAKFHVANDVEYMRYFVSFIIQFQFYKAACEKAGEYAPGNPKKELCDCDIYKSKAAGSAFKAMLEMGKSKPWPEAMKAMTGARDMSADAFLEYFEPLIKYFEKQNKKTGAHVGWESTEKSKCS